MPARITRSCRWRQRRRAESRSRRRRGAREAGRPEQSGSKRPNRSGAGRGHGLELALQGQRCGRRGGAPGARARARGKPLGEANSARRARRWSSGRGVACLDTQLRRIYAGHDGRQDGPPTHQRELALTRPRRAALQERWCADRGSSALQLGAGSRKAMSAGPRATGSRCCPVRQRPRPARLVLEGGRQRQAGKWLRSGRHAEACARGRRPVAQQAAKSRQQGGCRSRDEDEAGPPWSAPARRRRPPPRS